MRPLLLLAAIWACLFSGCGTFFNLKAPPSPGPGIGPTSCFPFGGVTRSALLGGFATAATVAGVCDIGATPVHFGKPEELLNGVRLAGLGIRSLIDIPFSLVGDVVTLPIAYARSKGAPWATWWGEQDSGLFLQAITPQPMDPPPDDPQLELFTAEIAETAERKE